MSEGPADELADLIGERVVIDVRGPYLYMGTLSALGRRSLTLQDADVHYRGDSTTTGELYVLEAKQNGVRPNRSAVYVMLSDVVSISRLADIVEY